MPFPQCRYWQSGQQTVRSSVQEGDPDSSRLAQHVVVLGSGRSIIPDTPLSTQSSRSGDSTLQQGASQGSDQSQSSHMAPGVKAIKKQGFSSPVAVRIEAPRRRSTRSVYEAKWAVFVRWCETSLVDFRSPSIEQVADFLLHLFQEKNLQPSTIDGYRSAITDKLGNASFNVSKNENLTRLLDIFHRDTLVSQRGAGEFPPGTSPWFCINSPNPLLNLSERRLWSIWPLRRFFS